MTGTTLDTVVVGAGIVGLATARELLRQRPSLRVAVLDKEDRVAAHQTGHNSGVIHAGLYYRPGSLKARLSVEGSKAMITFCEEHGVPYELCGKVVVATGERELPRLEELYRRGTANGVPGLLKISAAELREREPQARGAAALFSPRTGIVDYVAVARKYAELIQRAGGDLRLNCRLLGVDRRSSGLVIRTSTGELAARNLINCAGLQCDQVARMAGSDEGVRIVPFRGEYYELAPHSRHLVQGLIYPVPDPAFPFLGVHFTKKIGGSVEAGPNAVLAFAREGYRRTDLRLSYLAGLVTFPGFWVMASRYWQTGLGEMIRSWSKVAFVKALRKLLPSLTPGDLSPGGAGVRAQAMDARGRLLDDFCIIEAPNMVHVLNAPSPAATVSLAIGRAVVDRALGSLELGQN